LCGLCPRHCLEHTRRENLTRRVEIQLLPLPLWSSGGSGGSGGSSEPERSCPELGVVVGRSPEPGPDEPEPEEPDEPDVSKPPSSPPPWELPLSELPLPELPEPEWSSLDPDEPPSPELEWSPPEPE
jgi:hypothetical protein